MTLPYTWNPMPHVLDVKCPVCGKRARFEFAESVLIREKKDVPFFQGCDLFDYVFAADHDGCRRHLALYFAGLHGGTVEAIRELPPGYSQSDWDHSQYLYRSMPWMFCNDIGSICCPRCSLMVKHILDWPEDAYYQICYKGDVLWAFDRESAAELFCYVQSPDRSRRKYKWRCFLMKVPKRFLLKRARLEVSKKLRRLLAFEG